MFAEDHGVETHVRSSRGNEALFVSGFGFRASSFSQSLLTSAATKYCAQKWPVQRGELTIKHGIGRILRETGNATKQQLLSFSGKSLLFFRARGGLPFREQRTCGQHRLRPPALVGFAVEMPNVRVAEAIGVRVPS